MQVGVFDAPPETVLQKGRLMPGKMLLVDTQEIHSNQLLTFFSVYSEVEKGRSNA